MRTRYWVLLLTMGLVPLPQVAAHHAPTMLYDLSMEITVTGVVTEYQLGNPHMRLYLDVDNHGTTEKWLAEGGSRTQLMRVGWTGNEVKPGDKVTVRGHPPRDASSKLDPYGVPDSARRDGAVHRGHQLQGVHRTPPAPRMTTRTAMARAQTLTPRAVHVRHFLVGVLLAFSGSACAQTADPVDPVEPFVGTWSGVFTTQDHEYWTLADIQCFVGCPLDFYEGLSALLANPANDATPAMALAGQSSAAWLAAFATTLTPLGQQVRAANLPENDPKFLNCQPYGFVREVTNPLPMLISRDGDHLLVRYEEWSLLRPIYMDGRPQPTHRTPSLLGHSVGRVENGALIVETTRVTPDLISDDIAGRAQRRADGGRALYGAQDPHRLELTLTLTDPVTFTKPLVVTKTWLYTPDVEIVQDTCSQQPGKP